MKEVHYSALAQIQQLFGPVQISYDTDSGFQLGWIIQTSELDISFNFTPEYIRVFGVKKKGSVCRFNEFSLLRQCCKKVGLLGVVMYQFDRRNQIGEYVLKESRFQDGLELIEENFKLHPFDHIDEMGGRLMRIGSRRR